MCIRKGRPSTLALFLPDALSVITKARWPRFALLTIKLKIQSSKILISWV